MAGIPDNNGAFDSQKTNFFSNVLLSLRLIPYLLLKWKLLFKGKSSFVVCFLFVVISLKRKLASTLLL